MPRLRHSDGRHAGTEEGRERQGLLVVSSLYGVGQGGPRMSWPASRCVGLLQTILRQLVARGYSSRRMQAITRVPHSTISRWIREGRLEVI